MSSRRNDRSRGGDVPAYTLRVSYRGQSHEIGPFRSERALREEAEAYRRQGFDVRMLRGDTRSRDDVTDDDEYEQDRQKRRGARGGYRNMRDDVDDVDELDDRRPDREPRDTHPWFKALFGGER